MAALFLSLAIGYAIGRVKFGRFQLGGLTGSLLAAATTESASIGTASEGLRRLGLDAEEIRKLESNIGGGCLVSGLIFGWLRARRPTFGNLPAPTAKYLQEFGLAVFIVSVGLATGPQAVTQIVKYGLMLPAIGVGVALVPLVAQVLYGRYVLKLNPVILCGALAGNLTMTPALNMVIEEARSGTPVMGYTVSYAVSNVILTFLGPIIVFAV